MRWQVTPRLAGALLVVGVGLVLGVAAGWPEVLVLVAPLAVVLVTGLARTEPLDLRIAHHVGVAKVLEGDEVELVVRVQGGRAAVEVLLELPDGLVASAPGPLRGVVLPGEEELTFVLRAERWGTHHVGALWARAHSPLGLLRAEGQVQASSVVRAYPRPEALRRLLSARDTPGPIGGQVARTRGAGLDLADLRPLQPGDAARDINARASARRGEPWVTVRHPERSRDVIVFLDAFGGPTLPAAVRATDALLTAHLQGRDRVGLVSFGGFLRWVRPGMGLRQQYAVVDALLATREFDNVAWKGINLVPPQVLPTRSMVIAVTPLEDERMLAALVDLRARGVDLVVVEVDPDHWAPAPEVPFEVVGDRLWHLQREAQRDGYRRIGVPIVAWDERSPLTDALTALGQRRHLASRAG